MKVKASIDAAGYSGKPVHGEIVKINRRIAKCSRELEVQEIADLVGNKGHTFCPAVFSEGKRKKDHFLQMQLFGLDFDTGVSFDKIKEIAKEHELPIAFAYQTFSSTKDRPKFRVVFVNDAVVDNAYAAEIMLKMLFVLFPDTDKSCKDVSRMFFGGKGLLGEVEEKTINIMQLAQEFHRVIFEKDEKNYSRSIRQFAKENNIVCEANVLQIKSSHNDSEIDGKTEFHPYIYTSFSVFPSNKPKYVIYTGYQKNVHTKISEVSFCEAYVKQPEELKRASVIVTTHARLVLFSQEMIEAYGVIIDEDILSTFFKNVCSVSMETVKKVSSSAYCPRHLRDKLRLAEKLEEDGYLKLDAEPFADGLSEEELRELGISDNVNSFAYATVCCKRGETLYYFYPSALLVGKCTVLSATADAKLYRKYFKGREIVECAYKKAKYQGKLTQLSAYSMSRQCIQNHKESLKAYLQSLQEEYQIYQMITFKKYEEELNALGLHFGNAEGVDRLSGKNLIIVGTPHLDEMIYRLIGCHLGIEIGQEVLAVRKVRANGYAFNFMAYKGEELRELQFYFIHKELEQCIGRARLLRNDCKVLVLSNFPCEQAKLIQEDYLKERNEDRKKDNVLSLQPVMAGKH